MANEVQYIHSRLRAAPALSGAAGALLTVLEAWRTGFAASTAISVTVSGGIATVVMPSGETFAPDTVVSLTGATSLTAVNGLARVLTAPTSSTFTFATAAADGTAAGAISVRVAPSGWSRPFNGTNVAVYKPTAVEATGQLLKVDDSGTGTARVRGFESMTTIDNGLGLIPLDAQVGGGLYWPKSSLLDATARPWFIVSDNRALYYGVDAVGTGRYSLFFAGDVVSLKSGDVWSFGLTGNTASAQVGASTPPDGCCGYSGRTPRAGAYLSRSHNGAGGAIPAQRLGAHQNGGAADAYAGTSAYSLAGAYPNGPNNGLMLAPLELLAQGIRGTLPGLYHAAQDCADAFATGTVVQGTDDLAGRQLLAVRCAPGGGTQLAGTTFLDITGPWGR